jgi:hypothetical protein
MHYQHNKTNVFHMPNLVVSASFSAAAISSLFFSAFLAASLSLNVPSFGGGDDIDARLSTSAFLSGLGLLFLAKLVIILCGLLTIVTDLITFAAVLVLVEVLVVVFLFVFVVALPVTK